MKKDKMEVTIYVKDQTHIHLYLMYNQNQMFQLIVTFLVTNVMVQLKTVVYNVVPQTIEYTIQPQNNVYQNQVSTKEVNKKPNLVIIIVLNVQAQIKTNVQNVTKRKIS